MEDTEKQIEEILSQSDYVAEVDTTNKSWKFNADKLNTMSISDIELWLNNRYGHRVSYNVKDVKVDCFGLPIIGPGFNKNFAWLAPLKKAYQEGSEEFKNKFENLTEKLLIGFKNSVTDSDYSFPLIRMTGNLEMNNLAELVKEFTDKKYDDGNEYRNIFLTAGHTLCDFDIDFGDEFWNQFEGDSRLKTELDCIAAIKQQVPKNIVDALDIIHVRGTDIDPYTTFDKIALKTHIAGGKKYEDVTNQIYINGIELASGVLFPSLVFSMGKEKNRFIGENIESDTLVLETGWISGTNDGKNHSILYGNGGSPSEGSVLLFNEPIKYDLAKRLVYVRSPNGSKNFDNVLNQRDFFEDQRGRHSETYSLVHLSVNELHSGKHAVNVNHDYDFKCRGISFAHNEHLK